MIFRTVFLAAAIFATQTIAADKINGKPETVSQSGKPLKEMTLERALSIALRENPDILRAKNEIERTRGQVLEVRAQALPRLSTTASYRQEDKDLLERSGEGNTETTLSFGGVGGGSVTFGNTGNQFSQGGDKTWRLAVELRQTLYSGGQVGAALKIAKFSEQQSLLQLRDIVDRVVAQTRSQFYTILLNRSLIGVAEESIRLLEDELRDQKNRFDAGTVPRFNVLRAEVALANARPDLIRAKNNYYIAQLELARTLGLDAPSSMGAEPPFQILGKLRASERTWDVKKALSAAISQRASLKAQKQVILAEEQQITVAEAGYKPRLDASAGWEFRNSRRTDDVSKEANGWFFGINGSWNLFDGFETKGRVIQARTRLEAARINYAEAVQQVELEVQRAYARVREALELIASQEKVVEQALEALRLSRERLNAGSGTQLEVLDAQVALTTSRTTFERALAEYNIAVAEFDRSIGADVVRDNTLPEPKISKTKARLRKGDAELRPEE